MPDCQSQGVANGCRWMVEDTSPAQPSLQGRRELLERCEGRRRSRTDDDVPLSGYTWDQSGEGGLQTAANKVANHRVSNAS